MRVIDLLNKIANGETPETIKYDDVVYNFEEYKCDMGYVNKNYERYKWFAKEIDCDLENILNDEVEILDNEDEDIIIKQEQTNNGLFHDYLYYKNNKYQISVPQKVLFDEIDKIKQDINKLKKEGK